MHPPCHKSTSARQEPQDLSAFYFWTLSNLVWLVSWWESRWESLVTSEDQGVFYEAKPFDHIPDMSQAVPCLYSLHIDVFSQISFIYYLSIRSCQLSQCHKVSPGSAIWCHEWTIPTRFIMLRQPKSYRNYTDSCTFHSVPILPRVWLTIQRIKDRQVFVSLFFVHDV